jgi:hypothetical protein
MTPKEKAQDLLRQMTNALFNNRNPKLVKDKAKECAFVSINEVLLSLHQIKNDKELYDVGVAIELAVSDSLKYWEQVKQELQSL